MRSIQRKVLGAMLNKCNGEMIYIGTIKDISDAAGMKAPGGSITDALELLEYHNKILKVGERTWKITI